ncbi:YncE family protein [Pseudopedobacter beijingensis]|uniref:YncE family protein n=1 Tax=Pseudopedobacter beijingensis TaxID=1207056 RepID=A0ABW4IIR7_9SPHI
MRNYFRYLCFFSAIATVLSVASCRKDPKILPSEEEQVTPEDPSSSLIGFYLLNEGNMYMNKASLDYFDFTTGKYSRNIYEEANPTITKGLGDVGNDIGIYGSKLYVVVNNSNKVEVLDAKTRKSLAQIELVNCRYITFYKGKAYASAYLAEIGNPNASEGSVSEIDTTTLKISRKVTVGRQPEELTVVNNLLYVANSGGYSPENYETTVSVVDLTSFKEIKRIEVAPNLHRLKKDKYGDIYVTSRGDYDAIPSKLFVIDTQTDQVKKTFDIGVSNLWIDNDSDVAYLYASEFNYNTHETVMSYKTLNVKTEELNQKSFITDGTDAEIKIPYGISINPFTKEVYLTDAGNYTTPGTLYCFNKEGKKKWTVTTGDIPAHMAFVYK